MDIYETININNSNTPVCVSGCKNQQPTAQEAAQQAQVTTSANSGGFSGFDDAPRVPAGDDNNGDDLPDIKPGKLYSTHDTYHQVTCWYIFGSSGGWSLSCLPDSQIVNVKG